MDGCHNGELRVRLQTYPSSLHFLNFESGHEWLTDGFLSTPSFSPYEHVELRFW
jgi:hypothetical protein